ncbi:hypothetical protein V5O48_017714 [Marasmius crinis-equi]|uniref:HMG box domain-containing protein n=1 Tax=Marasmius crinis-equi TaxID=585013 RepID=A0ABR3EN68_9AGAR
MAGRKKGSRKQKPDDQNSNQTGDHNGSLNENNPEIENQNQNQTTENQTEGQTESQDLDGDNAQRGRHTWAKKEKLTLLLSYRKMFDKDPGSMYTQATNAFVMNWGYNLDPAEAPKRGKVYETKDINEFLGEERVAEEKRRAEFYKDLYDKILNWARYRWREKGKRAEGGEGVSELLKQLLKISTEQPKKLTERQFYQKEYYAHRLKPGFDEYWKSRSLHVEPTSQIAEINRYCDQRWAVESEEFKKELRTRMGQKYAKEMADYRARAQWNGDAMALAKLWAKAPNILSSIVLAISTIFGSGCTIFLYGPRADGAINVDSMSSTVPGAISKKDLADFDPEVYARMHGSCQLFAEALFSNNYCKLRKVELPVPMEERLDHEQQILNEALGNMYRSAPGRPPVAISGNNVTSGSTSDTSPPPASSSPGDKSVEPRPQPPPSSLSSSSQPSSSLPSSSPPSQLPFPDVVSRPANQGLSSQPPKLLTDEEWNQFMLTLPANTHDVQAMGDTGQVMMTPGGPVFNAHEAQPFINGNFVTTKHSFVHGAQSFGLTNQSFDNNLQNSFANGTRPFGDTMQSFDSNLQGYGSDFVNDTRLFNGNIHSYNNGMGVNGQLLSDGNQTLDHSPTSGHQTTISPPNDVNMAIMMEDPRDALARVPRQTQAPVQKPLAKGKENTKKRKANEPPSASPAPNTPPKRRRSTQQVPSDDAGADGHLGDDDPDDLDVPVGRRKASRAKVIPARLAGGALGSFAQPVVKRRAASRKAAEVESEPADDQPSAAKKTSKAKAPLAAKAGTKAKAKGKKGR